MATDQTTDKTDQTNVRVIFARDRFTLITTLLAAAFNACVVALIGLSILPKLQDIDQTTAEHLDMTKDDYRISMEIHDALKRNRHIIKQYHNDMKRLKDLLDKIEKKTKKGNNQ